MKRTDVEHAASTLSDIKYDTWTMIHEAADFLGVTVGYLANEAMREKASQILKGGNMPSGRFSDCSH